MTAPWPAYCETPELAVELSEAAQRVGLEVDPRIAPQPAIADGPGSLWLTRGAPELAALSQLASEARRTGRRAVACFPAPEPTALHALAADLGVAAVCDVEAAVVVAGLLLAGGERAHLASRKALSEALRACLPEWTDKADARAGRLERQDTATLCWQPRGGKHRWPLGAPAVARQALRALAALPPYPRAEAPSPVPHPDRAQANEVLFGPARRLSDPASKAALAPYGIPLPQEELCASPSRAASEAARMAFPVRITLASPDLRAWDEPDLAVDGVDNAARVRDVYRQLTSLAADRDPSPRVLGVTVAQTRLARSLLSVRARPLDAGTTLIKLGFADPHGAASQDFTWLPVPGGAADIERAVQRLRGHSLVLEGTHAERERTCEDLAALLGNLHAFLADFPEAVSEVRLHPLAQLVGGGLEAREAAISVTDAYTLAL